MYISVKEEALSQSNIKCIQKQMAERNLFLLKELFCFLKFYGVLSKSSCSIWTTLIIYIKRFCSCYS